MCIYPFTTDQHFEDVPWTVNDYLYVYSDVAGRFIMAKNILSLCWNKDTQSVHSLLHNYIIAYYCTGDHRTSWANKHIIVLQEILIFSFIMADLLEVSERQAVYHTGVTKTAAISPPSKTPAQPCLFYENTCHRKFTKTPAV